MTDHDQMQERIKEQHLGAISFMCAEFGIKVETFLTTDITSHEEFMDISNQFAVRYTEYCSFYQKYQDRVCRKKQSDLGKQIVATQEKCNRVKASIENITKIQINAMSLSQALNSCQQKLHLIKEAIILMVSSFPVFDTVVKQLTVALRGQKFRSKNKMDGEKT